MKRMRCAFVRAGILARGWKWLWGWGLGAFFGVRNFCGERFTVRTVDTVRVVKW